MIADTTKQASWLRPLARLAVWVFCLALQTRRGGGEMSYSMSDNTTPKMDSRKKSPKVQIKPGVSPPLSADKLIRNKQKVPLRDLLSAMYSVSADLGTVVVRDVHNLRPLRASDLVTVKRFTKGRRVPSPYYRAIKARVLEGPNAAERMESKGTRLQNRLYLTHIEA